MVELSTLDLDGIAAALQNQSNDGFEFAELIDPTTGKLAVWSSDTGLNDDRTTFDLEQVDMVAIEALPSHVWYQDMADFTELVSDDRAGRRLARALDGRGAFRRFRTELYEEYPDLLTAWHAFSDNRARLRAVEFLAEYHLVDDAEAERYLAEHPDTPVP